MAEFSATVHQNEFLPDGGTDAHAIITVTCGVAGSAGQTGHEEATTRLRKVVDIDDQETGTVRLNRTIEKADEMALDTASTKTTRVRK